MRFLIEEQVTFHLGFWQVKTALKCVSLQHQSLYNSALRYDQQTFYSVSRGFPAVLAYSSGRQVGVDFHAAQLREPAQIV